MSCVHLPGAPCMHACIGHNWLCVWYKVDAIYTCKKQLLLPLHQTSSICQEEDEVRGQLTFKPPVSVLPNTKRTEELQKRKIEDLKRKKEMAENLRKEKEKEEAMRRQREQQAKKEQQRQEQRRKEQERKRPRGGGAAKKDGRRPGANPGHIEQEHEFTAHHGAALTTSR